MKRMWLAIVMLVALLIAGNNNVAAQNKSGYFDLEYVINLMPGISRVDTLLAVYQQDSLGQQYEALLKRIHIYDSLIMVRGDVIGFKSNKDEEATYKMRVYMLQNWQQYSQQALQAK